MRKQLKKLIQETRGQRKLTPALAWKIALSKLRTKIHRLIRDCNWCIYETLTTIRTELKARKPRRLFTIYVDGAYNERKQTGGYGVVIIYREGQKFKRRHLYGRISDSAYLAAGNVATEFIATIRGIEFCEEHGATHINICHDFTGIAEWPFASGASKKPICSHYAKFMRHRLITRQLLNQGAVIRFRKVKAHSGQLWNTLADKLANLGMNSNQEAPTLYTPISQPFINYRGHWVVNPA